MSGGDQRTGTAWPISPRRREDARFSLGRAWLRTRLSSVALVVLLGAAGALPGSAVAAGASCRQPPELAVRLARLISTPDQADSLHQAFGAARDAEAILADVSQAWGVTAAELERASDADLKAQVARGHARDLERRNFVIRNGWVLSRSEAALYEVATAVARRC
jgi:hypothetical protein